MSTWDYYDSSEIDSQDGVVGVASYAEYAPEQAGEDDCQEDDSCTISPGGLLLVFYCIFAAMNLLFSLWVCKSDRDFDNAGGRIWSMRKVALGVAKAVVVGAFWPALWGVAFGIGCLMWINFFILAPILSCFCRIPHGDAIGWPIEAAERMLDCLAGMAGGSKAPPSRRLPSDHPWVRRGWLVMMRARYQTSLMRPAEGWMATCRRCFKRPRELAHPDAMANTTPTVYDIELQEFRAHGTNLSQIVVAAVEVEEEGLFRHIVMYL